MNSDEILAFSNRSRVSSCSTYVWAPYISDFTACCATYTHAQGGKWKLGTVHRSTKSLYRARPGLGVSANEVRARATPVSPGSYMTGHPGELLKCIIQGMIAAALCGVKRLAFYCDLLYPNQPVIKIIQLQLEPLIERCGSVPERRVKLRCVEGVARARTGALACLEAHGQLVSNTDQLTATGLAIAMCTRDHNVLLRPFRITRCNLHRPDAPVKSEEIDNRLDMTRSILKDMHDNQKQLL